MGSWNTLATDAQIATTIAALKEHQINALAVDTGEQAKQKVLELIPKGAEVMTMTSVTLDTIGLAEELNKTDTYNAVKPKLMSMNRETQGSEMQKLGAAPEWAVGSVHAVTQDGRVLIASNTGSQLPAYAYAAAHVVWVVGTQKIVANLDDGMKRLYEYALAKESVRAHEAYGVPASAINKILVVDKEVNPTRITLIFVKQELGF